MMATHARGTRPARSVDELWPYQVEIEVPWNGLGDRHSAIMAWLTANAPKPAHGTRTGPRQPGDGHTVRWCFAARETAAAFQRRFGGKLVTEEPPRRRKHGWP
jgi:hypothetical protein